jgi:membrane-associated protein
LPAVSNLIDIVLHLDKYLVQLTLTHGELVYAVLFAVIFMETGFVITPFLPGDSLLFAAGALAAQDSLNPVVLFAVFAVAAVFGDSVNYWIGQLVGPRAFREGDSKYFKRKYLDDARAFYEKYGKKTIVLARFVPIVRTFAPFVAGIAEMTYSHFLTYNIAGAILWVAAFTGGGYFFGNIPLVKENFSLVIFAVIILSLLPAIRSTIMRRDSKIIG